MFTALDSKKKWSNIAKATFDQTTSFLQNNIINTLDMQYNNKTSISQSSAHRAFNFKFLNRLLVMLNLKYDAKRHALPSCDKEKVKYIAPVIDSKIKHTNKSHTPYLPVSRKEKGVQIEEWIIKPNLKTLERTGMITENDEVIIFNNKSIKRDKYLIIKAEWARGETSLKVEKKLTSSHGRGYKKRTIETYYSYFSKALNLKKSDIVGNELQKLRKTG